MEAESTARTDTITTSTNAKPNQSKNTAATSAYPDNVSQTLGQYRVIRRNGKVTSFDLSKIAVAMTKAFINVEGGTAAASTRIHRKVEDLSQQVLSALTRRMPDGGTVHIEDIQDQVELSLMRAGEQKVARAYVIYREERARDEHVDGQACAARHEGNQQRRELDPHLGQ